MHQIKTKNSAKIKKKSKNNFYVTKILRVTEETSNNNIDVIYINANNNILDILTKLLPVNNIGYSTANEKKAMNDNLFIGKNPAD